MKSVVEVDTDSVLDGLLCLDPSTFFLPLIQCRSTMSFTLNNHACWSVRGISRDSINLSMLWHLGSSCCSEASLGLAPSSSSLQFPDTVHFGLWYALQDCLPVCPSYRIINFLHSPFEVLDQAWHDFSRWRVIWSGVVPFHDAFQGYFSNVAEMFLVGHCFFWVGTFED